MKHYVNTLRTLFPMLQPSTDSLVGAMKNVAGKTGANSPERKVEGLALRKWSPFSPLPNVSRFQIVVSKWHEVFLKFGLKKRINPGAIQYTPYKNKDLNRYVAHTLIRLSKMPDSAYWELAPRIAAKSRVFYMLGLRRIIPNWHRFLPWWQFEKIRKNYLEIVKQENPTVDFKRRYDPKPKGGWRPLGNPKVEWRIYLHILNQLLVYRVHNKLDINQHGFLPNRGTLTAWIDILQRVIKAPFIYEYDFKGYFDNLNQDFMFMSMSKEFNVSGRTLHILKSIQKSIPKLQQEDKTPEPDREVLRTGDGKDNPNLKDDPLYQEIYEKKLKSLVAEHKTEHRESTLHVPVWRQTPNGPEIAYYIPMFQGQTAMSEEIPSYFEDMAHKHAASSVAAWKAYQHTDTYKRQVEAMGLNWEEIVNPKPTTMKEKGVPQGLPTSPILSNFSLQSSLFKLWEKICQYADDGLLWFGWHDIGLPKIKEKDPRGRPAHTKESLKRLSMKQLLNQIAQTLFRARKLQATMEEFDKELLAKANEKVESILGHPLMKEAGAEIAPAKSGWVKFAGKWIKPLKFLGLEYDGVTNQLRSATRKGANLIFDKQSLMEELGDNPRGKTIKQINEESGTSPNSRRSKLTWENFVVSEYVGWVMSRLYNGSWNQDEFHQNFNLTHARGTWVASYWKFYRDYGARLNAQFQCLYNAYMESEDKSNIELPSQKEFENDLMSLTIFNSSSMATRAALEAMRIKEGMPPRQPTIHQNEESDPNDVQLKGTGWGDYTGAQKRAILDWQTAVAGGLNSYKAYLVAYISKIAPRSRYTPNQMWEFYMGQYVERKITHIERVLGAGERIFAEARLLLREPSWKEHYPNYLYSPSSSEEKGQGFVIRELTKD